MKISSVDADRCDERRRVVALSGGVGGAKLALGLSRALPPGGLTVVANTGDDFEHLGLSISPDLDTLTYALAGLDDPIRGWGRRGESWAFMETLAVLGGECWFQLGDRDLAVHLERTRRLAGGATLSQVTDEFRKRLGVASRLLPMSDDPVRTEVLTADGWLAFQDYFVRRQCEPEVSAVRFEGAERAQAHPDVLAALRDPDLRAVIVCPSNPLISIEPILAVPGIRAALANCAAPIVAVSPIIGGQAIKGPTIKMLHELGCAHDAAEPARRYADLLDGYMMDLLDASCSQAVAVPVKLARTLMITLEDRVNLAQAVLAFCDALSAGGAGNERAA